MGRTCKQREELEMNLDTSEVGHTAQRRGTEER